MNVLQDVLRVTKALLGVVSVMLIGTLVAIYFLVVGAPEKSTAVVPESVVDSVATAAPVVTTVTSTSDTVDGKDAATGLQAGEGLELVKANCLGCHSAKLVTQNRFTRAGWHAKIVWMQQTQGLWDLGENEPAILDYLAEHYAPETRARRRQPLTDIKWYKLRRP